ncbi:hypothetical protein M758_3G110800 [Ceratodon purpureus]|uniref:Ultraviolet-B-repressible protein n=1 Tax=Ceratodon purpureus TaxID=3225 RepID=A0A8T0IJU7_CERPU|nr:hypothetical protein KC19_3G109100 [Ceratodon purpureus]KAG0622606.1 hypothetical protein M758_3G110800 [Ceratodon purpureus]
MACAVMTSTAAVAALAPVVAKVPAHKGVAVAAPLMKKQAAVAVSNGSRVSMSVPTKEHNIAGLTGLALAVAAMVPEVAEAAQPGVSDSLRNLLLSVLAGGVVVTAIGVAVAGVSTFDPVSRR